FTPFQAVPGRAIWLGAAIGSSFAVLIAWRRSGRSLVVALGALALSVIGVLLTARSRGGPSTDDLLALLPWLPVFALGASAVALLGREPPATSGPSDGSPRDTLALLVFFAAAS